MTEEIKMDPQFVDTYPKDRPTDWPTFIAAGPPWCGALFKLTQGLEFEYANWAALQRVAFIDSARYGVDLFDGFYHFLMLDEDGTKQAEFFWKWMLSIGGEKVGTLPAMVDVERGGQRAVGDATHARKCIADFCARYKELSGRDATLYGGELLRALKLDRCGAGRSVVALYNSVLHGEGETTEQFLARTGTDLEHLLAWQWCGAVTATTTSAFLKGYTTKVPGATGALDISALELPGGLDALRALAPSAG